MDMDEIRRAAPWIVCPMCDEPKCLGRFTCPEIELWVNKKIKEYGVIMEKHIEDALLG